MARRSVGSNRGVAALWLGVVAVALGGCEPESIAEAREELSGRPDTLELRLPLLSDTVVLADAFTDSDTASTASGAFGLRVDRQYFDFGLAEALTLDDVSFEAFSVGYGGLLTTSEISRSFTVSAGLIPPPIPVGPARSGPAQAPPFGSDTIRFSVGNGATVVGADIAGGVVVRVIDNSTTCDLTTGVSLRDAGGVVTAFPVVSIPAGGMITDSLDLGGTSIQDFVEPDPTVSFTGCAGLPAGSLSVGFTFRPLSLASVTLADIDETFDGGYAPLSSRFDALDTVGIAQGRLTLDLTNRVPMSLAVDVTVDGLLEFGVPLQRSLSISPAPPGGQSVQNVDIDLVNAVLVPGDAFVQVRARAVADTAVLTPAIAARAADIGVSGGLDIAFLSGVLDPLDIPELAQAVEVSEVILPGDVDFDDLEDAVRGVTINDAQLSFLLQNGLGLPFSLDTFVVGVTRTDAGGQALRNGDGTFAFEVDSVGQPILLPFAPPGTDVVPVAAGGSLDLTRQAAPLVDRVVDLLLDDEPAALVTVGTVIAGDGTAGRVSAADSVSMAVDLVVGFDVLVPDTGLVFDVSEAIEGADLDPADIDEVTSRLIEARVIAALESGFPVELMVDVAIAPGVLADADDVFSAIDRVDVATILVPAATVDPATGDAVSPTVDTVSASLTGSDVGVLLGDSATVGVRVRVRAEAGASGRARLRSQDRLLLRLSGAVRALLGGS